MERDGRGGVITLYWPHVSVGTVQLTGPAVRHARVRRVVAADTIRLLDGAGGVATGVIASLSRDELTVEIERVDRLPPPRGLEVVVPVADRERMLMAAEKCVELQVSAWRPAYFARSRSVSPRGEGSRFREKVVARMQTALEQSGNPWLPAIHEEVEFISLLDALSPGDGKVLLHREGEVLVTNRWQRTNVLAVGPEGGLEPDELSAARDRGWTVASLAASTLRFETAIIAGGAVVRAAQLSTRSE